MTDDILVLKALIASSTSLEEFIRWTSMYLNRLHKLGENPEIKIGTCSHPVVLSALNPDVFRLRDRIVETAIVTTLRRSPWFHAFGDHIPFLVQGSFVGMREDSPRALRFRLCDVSEFMDLSVSTN